MRGFGLTVLYLAFTLAIGLIGYELPAKSRQLIGQPLPGWHAAVLIEATTPWQPRSGIRLLDRALHEATEAVCYYRLVLP